MKTKYTLAAAMLSSAVALPSFAGEGHADALLLIDPSGKLVTGGIDFDAGEVENVNTRVYEAEFDGPFGGVWTTDEPGFNSVSNTNPSLPAGYTTLPGSTDVSFDVKAFAIGLTTANLWYWDGIGGVNFAPVSSPTQLEISKSPTAIFSTIADGSASDVAGFVIDTTGADGLLHKHIDFTISNTDISAVDEGFYLWSLSLSAGSLQADPLYFVHGLGAHTELAHEAAVGFIESNVVPEPGSALALLAGVGLLAARRRRNAVS